MMQYVVQVNIGRTWVSNGSLLCCSFCRQKY